MDERPELLADALGDAPVVATVELGGGDVLAVTPAETHVYRSEGLISDESLETYDHDVERLSVDAGRRKHRLRLAAVDGERDFAVPAKVADRVVEAVLEGVLRSTGVVADGESVRATFRFSELTLVVTDARLCKHVGSAVWDADDFETVRYADLTRLDFEEGSVATQVVLQADGHQQRVKVPNDRAGRVREDVQSAVFEFHDVSSLGGLHDAIDPDVEETADDGPSTDGADGTDDATADETADVSPRPGSTLGPDDEGADGEPGTDDDHASAPDSGPGDDRASQIDAIIGASTAGSAAEDDAGDPDGADETVDTDAAVGTDEDGAAADGDTDDGFVSADWTPPADQDVTGPRAGGAGSTGGPDEADLDEPGAGEDGVDRGAASLDGHHAHAAVDELAARVDDLAVRLDRQNELLEAHSRAVEELVEEIRRGR